MFTKVVYKSGSFARLNNHVSPLEITNILRVRRGREGTRCTERKQQEPERYVEPGASVPVVALMEM